MSTCLHWNDLIVSTPFDTQISVCALDNVKTQLRAAWDKSSACEKPQLQIEWEMPILDIEYEWYPRCGKNRSLHVDWFAPVSMRAASGAPLMSFYNTAGINRLTAALSDAAAETFWSIGVSEERGTLNCIIRIPLDTSSTCEYAVVLYRDRSEIRFAEAVRRASQWWEQDCGMLPMPVPAEALRPLYSAWYSFHQNTIAAEIEAECARAKALGMDTVIVDDGWQTDNNSRGYGFCGDWEVCTQKIPDMRAHVEKIHQLGMKYMLWYSVPFLGEYSRHFEAFKNMTLRCIPDQHAYVLDPRYAAVRRYLIDTYVRALKEWNLDGFKLDFIDAFRSTSQAPAATADMDYTKVEDAVVRLMTDIMRELRAVKPDIMIEFRQSYIGPVMRTYGNMLRVGDCPADALSNRVGVIDLRLTSGSTAVHSDMLMWHPQDRVENAARQVLGAIFGVAQISMRLDKLPEDHKRMLAFYLRFMREHEKLLHAPIDVESPQNLYPLARTRLGDEEAVALYDQFPALLSDAKKTYLFNATAAQHLILRTEKPVSLHVVCFDCTGMDAGCNIYAASTLHDIFVPEGGMAVIYRFGA